MAISPCGATGRPHVIGGDQEAVAAIEVGVRAVGEALQSGVNVRLCTTEHQGSVAAVAIAQGQTRSDRQAQRAFGHSQGDLYRVAGKVRVVDTDNAAREAKGAIFSHGASGGCCDGRRIVDGNQGYGAGQCRGNQWPRGSTGATIVEGDAVIPGEISAPSRGIIAIVAEAYRLDNRFNLGSAHASSQIDGQAIASATTDAVNACWGTAHKQSVAGLITVRERNGNRGTTESDTTVIRQINIRHSGRADQLHLIGAAAAISLNTLFGGRRVFGGAGEARLIVNRIDLCTQRLGLRPGIGGPQIGADILANRRSLRRVRQPDTQAAGGAVVITIDRHEAQPGIAGVGENQRIVVCHIGGNIGPAAAAIDTVLPGALCRSCSVARYRHGTEGCGGITASRNTGLVVAAIVVAGAEQIFQGIPHRVEIGLINGAQDTICCLWPVIDRGDLCLQGYRAGRPASGCTGTAFAAQVFEITSTCARSYGIDAVTIRQTNLEGTRSAVEIGSGVEANRP